MDFDELLQKAESGSCVCQCILGLNYLYGSEAEVNYGEAFRWLSLAAEQGSSRAMLNLAHIYRKGLGVEADPQMAVRFYRGVATPSTSSDAFGARIALGRMYSRGDGVLVDPEEAMHWYLEATKIAGEDTDANELNEAKAYLASNSH